MKKKQSFPAAIIAIKRKLEVLRVWRRRCRKKNKTKANNEVGEEEVRIRTDN